MGYSKSFHNKMVSDLTGQIESIGLLTKLEADGEAVELADPNYERQPVSLVESNGMFENGNEMEFPLLNRRYRLVGYGLYGDGLLFEVPLSEAIDLPVGFHFIVRPRAISFVP